MSQLMPLPLTVSCFSKIQIGFTFLVPAHPGSPGKRAVKRVCVCKKSVLNVFFCSAAPSVSEEDELYEECVCETNLVYEAAADKLVEVERYSRQPLKYSMLHSRKVCFAA